MTGPRSYRGPDGDIDLEEALGPYLRHYVAVMVSGVHGGRTQVLSLGGSETPHGLLVRQGYGRPTRASSCGEVAVRPSFVWDVCAYYLRLRVNWRATKGEIRRAYVAACDRHDGQEQDERVTYAMAQLSDERVRRAYDMVPLGGIFPWDKEVAAQLRRAAAAEAGRRMAEGEEATADEVMEEMGFPTAQPEDPDEDQDGEGQEDPPAAPAQPPASRWGAQWGHYVLAGPQDAPRPDVALLEAWQGMVAAALRERGTVMEFAVAQGHEDAPLVLRDINEPCIFVLTQKGASPQEAQRAVEMGITLGIVTDRHTGGI